MTIPNKLFRRISLLFVVLVAIASAANNLCAQIPLPNTGISSGNVVSGTGTATIERLPTVLRISVDLLGRDSDLKTALTKLADRREAAQIQLATLKADAASIKIDEPSISVPSDQQRRLEQQILKQLPRLHRGDSNSIAQLPQIVTVKATLTAEWPLDSSDTEALLIRASELQESIKAADLGGAKDKLDLPPEQAELLEEIAQMRNEYGDIEKEEGTPHFIFAARLTDEERDKATAEAFTKAKDNAARLAKAAGAELGELVGVTSADEIGMDHNQNDYIYNQQIYAQIRRLANRSNSPDIDEVIGMQPGKLTVHISIVATFQLK